MKIEQEYTNKYHTLVKFFYFKSLKSYFSRQIFAIFVTWLKYANHETVINYPILWPPISVAHITYKPKIISLFVMAAWGGKEPHQSGFEHKLAIGWGPEIKRVKFVSCVYYKL